MSNVVTNFLPNLVLVHGLKESGKSTLADHLCNEYGYVRVKMAGPLKNMLRTLMRDGGIDEALIERYLEGDLKEVPIPQMSGRTTRQLMETLGDDWRRLQHEDFWIDIAQGKIEPIIANDGRVVIDDIRYSNEFRRFSIFSPLTFVTTRGSKHFSPVEPNRPLGERPMPLQMFHAHCRNNFETKRELWDVVDGVLEDYTAMRQALSLRGVIPIPEHTSLLAA